MLRSLAEKSFQRISTFKRCVSSNRQLPTNNNPSSVNMISRAALSRGAQLAARRQASTKLAHRGYAAAASSAPSSFTYETTDVAGVKTATRDSHGPTTKLAVVAKAGTRYQPAPGLTVGLEEFAFKARLDILRSHFVGQ